MIERIRKLLLGSAEGAGDGLSAVPDGDAAAAALLVEAASIDGDFAIEERHAIAGLMARKFAMDAREIEDLIRDAEQAVEQSVDHYRFARQVKDAYDHDARVGVIEMLWEVAYADGVVHDYEANLVRRVSGLLHVPDREAGEARKRVIERLDIQDQ